MKLLQDILSEGENEKVSFIENINNELEVAIQIGSLANTKGGSLFVGVKKSKKIIGINPSEILDKISHITNFMCFPPLIFKYIIHSEIHKFVCEIIIEEELNKPIKIKADHKLKIAYVRNENKVVIANKIKELSWSYSKTETKDIKLTEDEKSVLSIITDNSEISLNQIHKKSLLPLSYIDKAVAKLMYLNLINMHIMDKGYRFNSI
jgi:predicted HTH transcriptional regulator